MVVVKIPDVWFSQTVNHVMQSPYLVNRNHKNQLRNFGIKPRFQRFQNQVNKTLEFWTPWIGYNADQSKEVHMHNKTKL